MTIFPDASTSENDLLLRYLNLMEYALGGDPLLGDGVGFLPALLTNPDGRSEFSFQRDPSKTDLTYAVQVSGTLQAGSWISIASSTGSAANGRR